VSSEQGEQPVGWTVALVPIYPRDVVAARNGTAVTLRARDVVFIGEIATAEERKRFYEALLKIDWLPSNIRGAILQELGSSLSQEKHDRTWGETYASRHMIKETKARMRAQGERPKGGIHDAAVAEVAERIGITFENLCKRLQRFK
jgi:hypothetical protein